MRTDKESGEQLSARTKRSKTASKLEAKTTSSMTSRRGGGCKPAVDNIIIERQDLPKKDEVKKFMKNCPQGKRRKVQS